MIKEVRAKRKLQALNAEPNINLDHKIELGTCRRIQKEREFRVQNI
jgi:ribosomal protein S17